ncbi:anti-sigma factor domain-containing protein [Clostridium gasigenes]|uniref:anti-sigma factor domain-containing protein n=1 Tax=Clostridium gasigenes TaxID=94869 RepID=UPI001C0D1BBE|nr:anti-sigma factor domain-containing protein [Clostridium gasigenes]MBU3133595.1 anti-sigma factor domain-containing protein [Clostridium gasigenes]
MSGFDNYKFRFSSLHPLSLAGATIVKQRGNQIVLMGNEIELYNVLIKDLVNQCPSDDIRNQILNIAYYIVSDLECYEKTIKDRALPIIKIKGKIQVARSFLELWQDYIIAYVVILGNPNYKYIQDYLKIEESVVGLEVKGLKLDKSKEVFTGIVISKSKKRATILTSKGEFKKIDKRDNIDIGEEVTGSESKGLRSYKLHISIIGILIIIMVSIAINRYTTITKTIVINTTSAIKIEVNSFNKVVNTQSPTTKGVEMLKEIQIEDKGMDESLYEILKYSLKNEMIPTNDVLITVSGEMIDFETLEETKKFLEDNDIMVKFNNSGNEHYINQ